MMFSMCIQLLQLKSDKAQVILRVRLLTEGIALPMCIFQSTKLDLRFTVLAFDSLAARRAAETAAHNTAASYAPSPFRTS
jgi:hypothetical protein